MSVMINSETLLKRLEKQPLGNKNFSLVSVRAPRLKNVSKVSSKISNSSFQNFEPNLKKEKLQIQLKELQLVNKNLYRGFERYKKRCEMEMAQMRAEVREYREILSHYNRKGTQLQGRLHKQIEDLQKQISYQKSELEQKELDCLDEVKKISRALKNVQNRYISLQIKHQAMLRKTQLNQSKMKRIQDLEQKELTAIEDLKAQNLELNQMLMAIDEESIRMRDNDAISDLLELETIEDTEDKNNETKIETKESEEINESNDEIELFNFINDYKSEEHIEDKLHTTGTLPIFSPREPEPVRKEEPEFEEVFSFEVQTKDPNLKNLFKKSRTPAYCKK